MTCDMTRDVIYDVTCGRSRFKIGATSQTHSGLSFDNSKLTIFPMPHKQIQFTIQVARELILN